MRIVDSKTTINLIRQMKLFDKRKGEYIPFVLWPRQEEFVEMLHKEKKIAFLKKRQVGGSQLTGADSLVQCMLLSNFTILILSKTGDDAKEFLKRVIDMYKSLDPRIKAMFPLSKEPTMDTMEFVNGSRLISLAASKGEGYTGDRVIIDEAARINTKLSHITLDQVIKNVEPVLDKAKGQLILISKADGYNLFHKIYQKGKNNISSWKSFFFSCWDDPTFTKEDRKQSIRDHGEDHTNENYPRTDTEAFLMSGRCRFNRNSLDMMRNHVIEGRKGFLRRRGGKIIFEPNSDGWFEIFEMPNVSRGYVLGADYAEGIEIDDVGDEQSKHDFSTMGIYKKNKNSILEQVARMRMDMPVDIVKDENRKLAEFYGKAFFTGERNKDGYGVLKGLYNEGYRNLYYQEFFDDKMKVNKKSLGFRTTSVTKPELVAYMDELIRKEQVIIRSKDTLDEFFTYVIGRNGDTNAQSGCHDDEVIATMLACWGWKYAPAKYQKRERKIDMIDYYMNKKGNQAHGQIYSKRRIY